MSLFYDGLDKTGNFAIGDSEDNMIVIVDPETFTLNTQNVSDTDRLADSGEMEGKIEFVKYTLELNYNKINLEHFKEIYNNTQKKYNEGGDFFMYVRFPLYAENRTETIRGYFQSTLSMISSQTSEYMNDSSYKLGGENFDCMYDDITISFVQK